MKFGTFVLLTALTATKCEVHRVTLTFHYVNGSWVAVVPDPPPPTYTLSTKVIAALFLFLLFLVSFFGNILLISTISSSLTLRRISFYLILLQLGIVGLVESALNISISIAYLFTQPWRMGRIVCSVNAFLMEVVPIVETISLAVLTIDRTKALRKTNVYKKTARINPRRWKFYLGIIWVLATVLTGPLLPGLIQTWPFPYRYSCHPAHELASYYGMVTGSVLVLPWFSFLVCSVVIYRTIQVEKKRENKELRGQPAKLNATTAAFLATNQMWHELRNILLVAMLLVIYIVLTVPYIILTKYDQIRQYWNPYDLAYYRNLTTSYYQEYSDTDLDDSQPDVQQSMLKTLKTSTAEGNLTLQQHSVDYWEVPEVETGLEVIQTTFVWMRYVHCSLAPLLVLFLSKDVRGKAIDLIYFWGKRSPQSAAPRPISALLHRQSMELNRQKQMKKFKLTDYRVPVLFSTNEGMYLRMLDREINVKDDSDNKEYSEPSPDVSKNQWNIEPEFFTEICDLSIEINGSRLGGGVATSGALGAAAGGGAIKDDSEDEGFHDANSRPNSNEKDSPAERKDSRKVQFRTTVMEIPEIKEKEENIHPGDPDGGRHSVLSNRHRRHSEASRHHGKKKRDRRKSSQTPYRRLSEDNGRRASTSLAKPENDIELQTFQSLESRFGMIK